MTGRRGRVTGGPGDVRTVLGALGRRRLRVSAPRTVSHPFKDPLPSPSFMSASRVGTCRRRSVPASLSVGQDAWRPRRPCGVRRGPRGVPARSYKKVEEESLRPRRPRVRGSWVKRGVRVKYVEGRGKGAEETPLSGNEGASRGQGRDSVAPKRAEERRNLGPRGAPLYPTPAPQGLY